MKTARLALSIVLLVGASAPASAQEPLPRYPRPEARYAVRVERDVMVPMRDDTRLATDLYFPTAAEEPLPVIMIRTPYGKTVGPPGDARFFAGQGYVVAVQDVRGRFGSEGRFTVSAADTEDGFDAMNWLADQAWSSGKVGTYGCSYLGENQIQTAKLRNPHHAAAIPQAAGGAARYFGAINGGVFELSTGFGWFRDWGFKIQPRLPSSASREDQAAASAFYDLRPNLPAIDYSEAWRSLPLLGMVRRAGAPPSDWDDFVSHPPGDEWWKAFGYIEPSDSFDVPALHVNSWNDLLVRETLKEYALFGDHASSERSRRNQYLIISPTPHCQSEQVTDSTVVGERFVGDPQLDYWRLYLDWFDHWLRGLDNGVEEWPHVRYYLMGRNEWRTADAWPVPGTRVEPWFLHSGGSANSLWGDGTLSRETPGMEPSDRFTYDPGNPTPSLGGPVCCTGTEEAAPGMYDQRAVEARNDVLVYTSAPLDEGIEVTGAIEVVLEVSSDARDTDFTAKLVDLYPDGTAYNLQEGVLRARYREGYDRTVWMEDGGVYELRLDLQATSNWFGPGHRIRLEISSSSFPRFERNLNTGGRNFDETEWVIAHNVVHHSRAHPSRLLLPVVSRGDP